MLKGRPFYPLVIGAVLALLSVPSGFPEAAVEDCEKALTPPAATGRRKVDLEESPPIQWDMITEVARRPEIFKGLKQIVQVLDENSLAARLGFPPTTVDQFLQRALISYDILNSTNFTIYRVLRKYEESKVALADTSSVVQAYQFLLNIESIWSSMFCHAGPCSPKDMAKALCEPPECAQRLLRLKNHENVGVDYLERTQQLPLFGQTVVAPVLIEMPRDSLTGATSFSDQAKRYLRDLIEQISLGGNQDNWVYFYFDINDLGVVNTFRDGSQSGDRLIRRAAMLIRRMIRREDIFFRRGGDELVVLAKGLNDEEVVRLGNRIVESFANDERAKKVFTDQWAFIDQVISEIRGAEKFESLSESTVKFLKGSDVEKAKAHFQKFKSEYIPELEQLKAQYEVLLSPKMAVGSRRIGPNDNWETVDADASLQSNFVKNAGKEKAGARVLKTGAVEIIDPQRFNDNLKNRVVILPEIQPPTSPSRKQ